MQSSGGKPFRTAHKPRDSFKAFYIHRIPDNSFIKFMEENRFFVAEYGALGIVQPISLREVWRRMALICG